ncbi:MULTISPECIES: hypothetical protein [unclassified Caballeronia]|uniref:hypothetical protein n=1 Tax=unclassified Caballeronia TaxID=2646786 RepID=UPI0028565640|nr:MULTISPECIES: hypothetical protein [unclassified Caballeronia]MDR5750388.1 hypothetical protein [Caballeronia sp. LZ024]MDR5842579.1 hypothetical protein [Caballeronia sp. LZ031]
MPVDLTPAGRPSAYPRRMRFWPWAITWFVCNVCGAMVVLLAWPNGEPASGLKFWSWIVGAPSGLFLVLLGFGRAGYEALWYRAYWRNHHRDRWLAEKIRFAQRPLHVLDAGYCLPLGGKSLSEVLAGKRSILKAQAARHGSGKVLCNRFEDNDPLLAGPSIPNEEDVPAGNETVLTTAAPVVQMIRVALEPLVGSIQALTRYQKAYWPQVRVLAEPEVASLRLAQVRDAMRLAALPPLEVQAVPAADGLLVVDAWLDAREHRPLLVVAAAWYDDDIDEGLAEGCAAVLLDAGYFRLPQEVSRKATLHRPIADDSAEPEYGFANAAIWGNTDAAAVTRAWITRAVEGCDRALRAAGFVAAAKDPAQYRLDRIVGDVRSANGLLAIAGAVESGVSDGPQLVVDGRQSAILHVIPAVQTASTHDDTQK